MRNRTFIKFILRHIVRDIEFSLANSSFSISLRTLSESARKSIYEEGRSWGLTDKTIENLINETNNKIDLYRNPTEEVIHNVDVNKAIPQGGLIQISYTDNVLGKSILKIMRIDSPEANRVAKFILLQTNILSLHPNDILDVYGSTSWDLNHRVLFRITRNGELYPDAQSVFSTGKLENITLLRPSLLYEVIDSRLNFTYKEDLAINSINKVANNLSFGKNPMSLLLHQHVNFAPLYADFDDNGSATFNSNGEHIFPPSQIRDILFSVDSDNKSRKLKIITKKKGEFVFNKKERRLMMVKPATADYKILT